MPSNNPPRPRSAPTAVPETVDPAWILKAIGAVIALGLLCSYIMLCVFFYVGQGQFVLHPSRTVAATPASQGLAFSAVRFADDASGQPQLAGWWLPSDAPTDPTVLLLHSETGSMSDALPSAKALHDARLNVFLFDYRGYGQSGGRRPSEVSMRADASAALRYVLESGHAHPGRLLVYGTGLSASLAVRLCTEHADLAGLILQDADGDTLTRIEADGRSRVVPVSLLFHERFPLADALRTLPTPKLLISYTRGNAPIDAQRAADPKMTVELAPDAGPNALTVPVRRFLDTYTR